MVSPGDGVIARAAPSSATGGSTAGSPAATAGSTCAQPRPVLRLLLLRDGPPPRHRPDQRDGAQARARRPPRPADARRSRRATCPTPPGRRRTAARTGPPATASTTGIGQGFTLASPLQLAVYARASPGHRGEAAAGAQAIDGVAVPVDAGPAARHRRPRHLHTVRDGMYAVSNEGTAFRSRIADPAMLMAGKTGTSQVRDHHRRRARRGRHQERAAAVEPPRPRALRLLRALRRAALRHRR